MEDEVAEEVAMFFSQKFCAKKHRIKITVGNETVKKCAMNHSLISRNIKNFIFSLSALSCDILGRNKFNHQKPKCNHCKVYNNSHRFSGSSRKVFFAFDLEPLIWNTWYFLEWQPCCGFLVESIDTRVLFYLHIWWRASSKFTMSTRRRKLALSIPAWSLNRSPTAFCWGLCFCLCRRRTRVSVVAGSGFEVVLAVESWVASSFD